LTLVLAKPATGQAHLPELSLIDGCCDAVARPTDSGADGLCDTTSSGLIDLLRIDVGSWRPDDPRGDVFVGQFEPCDDFVRIDLSFAGVVNPPGPNNPDPGHWFHPRMYGDRPIYGFIEIDMDHDNETGGETDTPWYHFLGNVVRFGGKPTEGFPNRVATQGSDIDDNFLTPPYVERHGEEFHLAFLDHQFTPGHVIQRAGDGDFRFECGETWDIVDGYFFHRAHGYEPFTFGEVYAMLEVLRFSHNVETDITVVSLVVPANNWGAAQWRDEPEEPHDTDWQNQASIEEAFYDLWVSATDLEFGHTGWPEEAIITRWKDKDNYAEFVFTANWKLTALIGTAYLTPEPTGARFVWTDIYPNVQHGDVNGDGAANVQDTQAVINFIAEHDAADGALDGQLTLSDFAFDFSVFDVNYDGRVDGCDELLVTGGGHCDDGSACTENDVCSNGVCEGTPVVCDDGVFCNGVEYCDLDLGCVEGDSPCPADSWCRESTESCETYGDGDFDADGDVDLFDFYWFQRCFNTSTNLGCEPGNMTGEPGIDANDFELFGGALLGPNAER
jgi:hypothetical protein